MFLVPGAPAQPLLGLLWPQSCCGQPLNRTQGWAVLELLIPTSLDPHQGTSALSALLSNPARGAGPPLKPGVVCASTSPFPGPAGLLLMSTLVMPSQPFATLTRRTDVRLTSAPCCWQHGTPALPDPTRTDPETFLTLQRPLSIQPLWESPRAGFGMHLRAQHEPGQPHYGLCSATAGHRRYLLRFICKYRKDVMLFVWSVCLLILS